MRRCFFSFLIACLATAPATADVLDVLAAAAPGGARLTISLAAKQQYRVFSLADPARVVVDLPKARWRGDPFVPGAAGVTGLRHGQFRPGLYRLVFDLDRDGTVAAARLDETDGGHRLLIDLTFGAASTDATIADVTATAPSVTPPTPPAADAAPLPPRRPPLRTIVLDAGHGGPDPGAIGQGGVVEKRVVLAVVKAVRQRLEARAGYKVVLTRERDMFLRLRERVRRGREAEADLFVSIHADSHPNPHVSGASLYTLSETASDKEAARLAQSENKADLIGGVGLDDEPVEVYGILLDLAQRETQNQSSAAADDLLFALAANQPLLVRPKRSAGFAVLKAPDVPSVLIELGFLSNPADARRLGGAEGRERIASAIAEGIFRYFDGANTARAQARGQVAITEN